MVRGAVIVPVLVSGVSVVMWGRLSRWPPQLAASELRLPTLADSGYEGADQGIDEDDWIDGVEDRVCYSAIPSRTLSVMLLGHVGAVHLGQVRREPPCVSPSADNDRTKSSTPLSRRCHFRTICGSNMPAAFRGTRTCTGPTSVSTILVRLPLHVFPLPRPASCLS